MEFAKIIVTDVCAQVMWRHDIPTGIVGGTITVEWAHPAWAELNITAVFRGCVTRDVLNVGTEIEIPHECVEQSVGALKVGFYGVHPTTGAVMPTFWAELGRVRPGADPSGDESTEPSLPVWAQLQAMIGNLEELDTETKASLVAAVNEAMTKGGGEGGGSSALYVTIDENGLASHSASEILAAAEGGQEVYLSVEGANLTYTHVDVSRAAQFIMTYYENEQVCAITATVAEDKAVTVGFVPINTEVWYVTVTGDETHGYTADRDYLEIYDAYRAGMTVLCRLTINETQMVLSPVSIQDITSVFFLADVGTSVRLTIDDKGATVTLGEYVTSVNGKTKNVKLTAADVGALPSDTVIPTVPTNVSAFENDAGYLTEYQDLSGYAKTEDTYTKTEIDAIMGAYINDIDTLVGGDA